MFRLLGTLLLITTLSGCANSLFYFPDRVDYEPRLIKPIPHEDVWLNSHDGLRLHGWWLAAQGEVRGTVVFLHGNAQNLTAHAAYVDWLPAAGYQVLIIDYRGYGLSAGQPSRRGVFEDAKTAWHYAYRRAGVTQDKMILLGQSLGGANALALAGRERLPGLRAVIADSAFSGYTRIGREKMLDIPVLGWLLWPFSPLIISPGLSPDWVADKIAPVPLLLIHGDRDQTVPAHHSERLYEKAASPKLLWILHGADHAAALGERREQVLPRLRQFMDYALGGGEQALHPADRVAAGLHSGP